MSVSKYQVADRRPIASRNLTVTNQVAAWLAARRVTANTISVLGMLSGAAAGLAFAATHSSVTHPWWCWLLGALFVQLRLLANLFDGMVAVLSNTASPVGELYNEVPDRVSDAATLIGLGYAAGSSPVAGLVASSLAIFVAYVRAMGKVAGAHQEFCGPMAKPQRMATVTVCAVICAVLPGMVSWQLPMVVLWIISAGCLLTAIRRLNRIAAALKSS